MKLQRLNTISLLAAMGALCAIAHSASAQLPVSRPVGTVPVPIIGGGKFSGIGFCFTREPIGRVTVVNQTLSSGNTTINLAETLTGGSLARATNPTSVVLVTGDNRGRAFRVQSNSTTSVTVIGDTTSLVAADAKLELIPEWTFATLFGTGTNPSGLSSNSTAGNADIVYISDGTGLVKYFHNNTQWRRETGSPASANNTSLGGLNGGVFVLKRSAGNLTFGFSGAVRSGRQIVDIVGPALSIVSYTEPKGTTLGNSSLVPGLTSNSTAANADIVYLPYSNAVSDEGSLIQYFHNATNWRRVSGSPTNQNPLPIRPAGALMINKKAGSYLYSIREHFEP